MSAAHLILLGGIPNAHTREEEPAWIALAGAPPPPTMEQRVEADMRSISEELREKLWLESLRDRRASGDVEYHGVFDADGVARVLRVTEDGPELLRHRGTLSQRGVISWGYSGSGPTQLDLLADARDLTPSSGPLTAPYPAVQPKLQRRFVASHASRWPQHLEFAITRDEIRSWYDAQPDKPRLSACCRVPLDAGEPCWNCVIDS